MQSAQLVRNSNFVHSTAVIDPSVQLGENNYIGPYCVIGKGALIGSNNRFEAFCSIAAPPEHKDFWHGDYQSVVIGNNCVIREYVTINSGTKTHTQVGNNVIFLRGAHVGHDSIVEDNVTMACHVLLSGHSHICEGANLGLNVAVHQYAVVGHYAMVGMSAVITKKAEIEPFKTYIGNPARFLKNNEMAIKRNKLSLKDIDDATRAYLDLKKSKV